MDIQHDITVKELLFIPMCQEAERFDREATVIPFEEILMTYDLRNREMVGHDFAVQTLNGKKIKQREVERGIACQFLDSLLKAGYVIKKI